MGWFLQVKQVCQKILHGGWNTSGCDCQRAETSWEKADDTEKGGGDEEVTTRGGVKVIFRKEAGLQ